MPRFLNAAVLAAGLASAALPALAQTAAPMAGTMTELDRQYMILAATGGAYELSLASLAQQRSSRDDIKAYAATLIQDHANYNAALQELARAKGVTLPTAMSKDDQDRLNTINLQGGSTLDRSFIEEATRINAEDKTAAATEAAATTDPDIKAFLQKFAAMDARHEQGAIALRR